MIGYAMSLTIMLALVNIPVSRDSGGNKLLNFDSDSRYDEPLPLITVHEVAAEEKEQPRVEVPKSNPELPPVEVELEYPSGSAEIAHEAPQTAAILATAVLSSKSALRSLDAAKRNLRTAIAPPTVDREPKLRVGTMMIKYPLSALKRAIQGLVIVKFTVETDGRAHAIKVVHGLDPACDDEVVQALERARFIPGRYGGRPVPAESQMTVRFVLADAGVGGIVGP